MRASFVAVLALSAAAGCGSDSTSCSDACQALVSCENKLAPFSTNMDLATCTSQCNAGTCSRKQQLIDCVRNASLRCDSPSDKFELEIVVCQVDSGCSIGG